MREKPRLVNNSDPKGGSQSSKCRDFLPFSPLSLFPSEVEVTAKAFYMLSSCFTTELHTSSSLDSSFRIHAIHKLQGHTCTVSKEKLILSLSFCYFL